MNIFNHYSYQQDTQYYLYLKKREVKNIYQLQAAKQYYKKGLIPITINFRNLRQNRQHKDLFKDRSKIGILLN